MPNGVAVGESEWEEQALSDSPSPSTSFRHGASLPQSPTAIVPASGADWDTHKMEIAELYIQENRPLKEVMERMRTRFNFKATYVGVSLPHSFRGLDVISCAAACLAAHSPSSHRPLSLHCRPTPRPLCIYRS